MTLPEKLGDESAGDESGEHDVVLVVAREDATLGLEAVKQALDFIAPTVQRLTTWKFSSRMLPRWRGSSGATCSNCSRVSSIPLSLLNLLISKISVNRP